MKKFEVFATACDFTRDASEVSFAPSSCSAENSDAYCVSADIVKAVSAFVYIIFALCISLCGIYSIGIIDYRLILNAALPIIAGIICGIIIIGTNFYISKPCNRP